MLDYVNLIIESLFLWNKGKIGQTGLKNKAFFFYTKFKKFYLLDLLDIYMKAGDHEYLKVLRKFLLAQNKGYLDRYLDISPFVSGVNGYFTKIDLVSQKIRIFLRLGQRVANWLQMWHIVFPKSVVKIFVFSSCAWK